MQVNHLPFDRIKALSDRDIAYQTDTQSFAPFIQHMPELENFKQAIELKSSQIIDRSLLVDVLRDHYIDGASSLQQKNIDALANTNTFTIVTAHQPSLLGGPSYYIYKICSVINLCKQLKEAYPNNHFVPVFVNGSEDHDFDEVKSINMFSKTIQWNTQQAGPVGRFGLDGIKEVIQEFKLVAGETPISISLASIFEKALSSAKNYNEFVFSWLNALFCDYGLIVLNMDDARLKRQFIPIIKEEIFAHPSEALVKAAQDDIQSNLGYKPQAFPREINFFYLTDQSRNRIIVENDTYQITNTDIKLTKQQMEDLIDRSPENFSPNVITRPLYQEFVLPNLAYIGGGGELAYWMERKAQFAHFGLPFPMLVRRNSLMFINKGLQKNIAKLAFTLDELLMDEVDLVKHYVNRSSGTSLDLTAEYQKLNAIFESLSAKAKEIDPSLDGLTKSEATKATKMVEAIEARFVKSIKAKEETSITQIKNIKAKLFPNGGLQERSESFWNVYINAEEGFLDSMIELCNPMQKEFLFVNL